MPAFAGMTKKGVVNLVANATQSVRPRLLNSVKLTRSKRAATGFPLLFFARKGAVLFSMKTLLQPNRLVLIPETDDERLALSSWRAEHDDFVFAMQPNSGTGAALAGLGPRHDGVPRADQRHQHEP